MKLEDLMTQALPLNRKERFYTGTVFPMIAGCQELQHLNRLLRWFGLNDIEAIVRPDHTNLQFFTEYGFGESRMTDPRFVDYLLGRDTPDIVLFVDGERRVLIGLEGKMYDTPSRADLDSQIGRQQEILDYVASKIHAEVFLAALVPQALAIRVGDLTAPTLTWEALMDMYEDVAPPYWREVLQLALNEYERLVAKGLGFGANRYGKLSGSEILQAFEGGTLEFTWMGRKGGLDGTSLAQDLQTGKWRSFQYECRFDPLPVNPNWFPVAEFVARLHSGQIPPRSFA